MPEFTQALATKLAGVPWSIKVTSGRDFTGRETCYFFKYTSDALENTCSFMITDTINVWAEVLDSKYTSHRARHAHSTRGSPKRGFALPYHDADEEADWRRGVVRTLGEVHGNATEGNMEFEVKESELADLSVYISDMSRGFHWRWDVMSVGRMAGEILSKQLFMPMVTLATVVSGIGQSVDDASEDTLRTVAERKASTAKVMPAHHLRGFISRPGVQTILKSIAQVDAAPTVSGFELPASKLASTPSFDMADPPDESPVRDIGLHSRVPTSLLGDSLNRSDGFGARKGKGRDGTDEDEGGSIRKMRRGATPRRSDVLALETPTTRRSSFPRSLIDPDSTTTEAETTRELSTGGNNSYSQTMDEDDIGAPAAASSQPPPPPSSRLASASPKLSREKEKPKLARAPPRAPVDNSDVFGATQTQTQASSDDSDREAELARRVRAAGAIGSAAVRTPAGGLGSRMVRKKF